MKSQKSQGAVLLQNLKGQLTAIIPEDERIIKCSQTPQNYSMAPFFVGNNAANQHVNQIAAGCCF